MPNPKNKAQNCQYNVVGMHCRSCELLIKDKLEEKLGIKDIKTSYKTGKVEISTSNPIDTKNLNKLFKAEGYTFSQNSIQTKDNSRQSTVVAILIALGFGTIFILLSKLGLASGFQVSASTAWGGVCFWTFGR